MISPSNYSTTFLTAKLVVSHKLALRPELREWTKKLNQTDTFPRVCGLSLGNGRTIYIYIYCEERKGIILNFYYIHGKTV